MSLDRSTPAAAAPVRALVQMAATFATSDLVRGAVRLMTSLAIARGVGRDGFGAWTLASAWASALTVTFDLGFGVLLTREAARDERQARSLVAGALFSRLALYAPIAVACAWVAPAAFGGQSASIAVVALAGVGIVFGSIAAVFRTAPRRLLTIAVIDAGGAAAQLVGAIALIKGGATTTDLLWLSAVVVAAQCVVAAALLRAEFAASQRRFSIGETIGLLRRALPFAASGLVANAQARLGPIALGGLSGAADVAAFGVATRIEAVSRRLSSAAFGAALPVFSSRARSTAALRTRFDRAVGWFAAVAAITLIGGAAPLVRLLYGPAFSNAAIPLMCAGAALVPSLVNASRKVYLNAVGGERAVLRWSAVALGVQGLATVALIPHAGAAGAALAAGAGELAIWWPLRCADRRHDRAEEPDAGLAVASVPA